MPAQETFSKAEVLRRFPNISARQLKRWQQSRLIDAPIQTHRPGLRGSVILYTARALEQIAALRNAAREEDGGKKKRVRISYRRSEKAFALFWEGHDALIPDPHEVVRSTLSPIVQFRSQFGMQDAIEEVEPTDRAVADDEIEEEDYGGDRALQLVEEQIRGNEDEMRNKIALGRMSNADVSSFAYAAAGLFFGSLTAGENLGGHDSRSTYADVLLRGYGLAGSREHPSPFSTARNANEQIPFFDDLKDRVELILSESFLRSLSVEDLRQARNDARRFIEDFGSFGTYLSRLVGTKALGLAAPRKRLASASNEERAMLMLMLAHARKTMPDKCTLVLDSVGKNAKTFRDALSALKNLTPQQQKVLKSAMRLAARNGLSESASSALTMPNGNEAKDGST